MNFIIQQCILFHPWSTYFKIYCAIYLTSSPLWIQ